MKNKVLTDDEEQLLANLLDEIHQGYLEEDQARMANAWKRCPEEHAGRLRELVMEMVRAEKLGDAIKMGDIELR